ncbi:hypothetical protein PFICI_13704 [Pestalotiopsis fici W106-1]|uniref:Cytochrome P450 n=1 Tax=Pestalotiopsis fici (strain W106-1 / CGMCC3.15140) TaxID=1229662 RepID=W3WMV6_PESFW|nr:uncharacterized protein PFICI_13704 [Pestalotiopsis fici W106-1]ETS75220.1 hypothetical protein PFICI_13704 [Pestalotiopsis fici W106-1]
MAFFYTIALGIGYMLCIAIPYFILRSTYYLGLHPLRDYNGPFLAKISDSYAGSFVLRRRLPLVTHDDHKHYGSVMRYGPNRLVFNSVTAIRDIYQNPRTTKSHLYLFSTNKGVPFIFNTLDRSGHARKRKIIGPALSERSMRMFEPIMSSQVDVFLKYLLKSGSNLVDVSERFRRLAMDIVVHLAYGYPLDLQLHDEHYFILKSISLANWKINSFMNWPLLSKMGIQYLLDKSPVRKQWKNVIEKMIQTRVEQDSPERRDFYSFVLQNLDAETADFRQSELFSESLFFISAGGDTVSTAMAGTFFYLARNKRCYDKLAEEIRGKFKTGGDIHGGQQLSSCLYLRACINETLRMSPPVGGTLWREAAEATEKEPFVVDGHIIPPGTHVGVNTYSIHHNEEYFPDPFTFTPERWLETAENDAEYSAGTSTQYRAFVPFSVGMRSCAGKPMAYLETSLILAKTLWYFDFERCEGSLGDVGGGKKGAPGGRGRVDEFQLYDVITSRHDGPWLKFTPRGNYFEDLF